MPQLTVAVIGGGMAGICSARSCLREGLAPTLFEASPSVGGHWSLDRGEVSGVFDNLLTNISYYESVATDVLPIRNGPNRAHGDYASMFLSLEEWNEYFMHVIKSTDGLAECMRMNSRVHAVRRVGERYTVTVEKDGTTTTEEFDRVVIATGRNQKRQFPEIKGFENFRGSVMHSKDYRNPQPFKGKRVLIVGGSVSGSECAGDLADTAEGEGPQSITFITSSMKHFIIKEREKKAYIAIQQRQLNHLRVDSGAVSVTDLHAQLRPDFEKLSKNTDFGLPPFEPGTWVHPAAARFLHAVKDGSKLDVRVVTIDEIDEEGAVVFADGTKEEFDAIIFGTGFGIDLDMFDEDTQRTLFLPTSEQLMKTPEINLHLHTWNPSLPGCAFVGMFVIIGSAFAIIDMQSRWVARAFADPAFMPAQHEMKESIDRITELRKHGLYSPVTFLSQLIFEFARRIGCDIDYYQYPELAKCLMFGPFLPIQFRICGYGAVSSPVEMYRRAASQAGLDVENVEVSEKDIALMKECIAAFQKQGRVPKGLEKALAAVENQVKEKDLLPRS